MTSVFTFYAYGALWRLWSFNLIFSCLGIFFFVLLTYFVICRLIYRINKFTAFYISVMLCKNILQFVPLMRVKFHSKIPISPVTIEIIDKKGIIEITQETVDHLERNALVDLANKKGLERLQSAIGFACQISHVDTSAVEPMISVLEDRNIYLRDDKIDDGNCRDDVMSNATVTEEEYFVAPPGNIPVTPRKPIIKESSDSL